MDVSQRLGSSADPFVSVRDAPELRGLLQVIDGTFRGSVEEIDRALAPAVERPDGAANEFDEHVATIREMCRDVLRLTERYVEFLDAVDALPEPRPGPARPEALLAAVDREVMPEAIGRGVAWSCGVEGPTRPLRVDAGPCVQALTSWALLVVRCSGPGHDVSLTAHGGGDSPTSLTLSTTAIDALALLAANAHDPLFRPDYCLEAVGADVGSQLGLAMEHLARLGGRFRFSGDGPAAIRFGFPIDEGA